MKTAMDFSSKIPDFMVNQLTAKQKTTFRLKICLDPWCFLRHILNTKVRVKRFLLGKPHSTPCPFHRAQSWADFQVSPLQ